ncbi:MAG: DMT family transporter [Desulfovibrio sp.]|nr:DMT family transporter [Desulfovibrio sp.]
MADQTSGSSEHSAQRFLEGNACILAAAIFWGANVAVTKALIPDWMSAYGITCVRLIGGCLLFWLASIFVKCHPVEKDDWLHIVLGGVVGLFSFIFLFVTSLRFGSAIDISIIMTLPPMFVILINVVFRGARPKLLEYIGVIVSFIGAAIVILAGSGSSGGGNDYLLGDFLAIISTICYAFYLIILEKPTPHYKPVNLLRWVFLFAAMPALLLVKTMPGERIFHEFQWDPWMEILFILFFPTFIAYFLVQPAIKFIGSELVSLYQYTLPIFAALAAVMMGLEQIVASQVVAMAVIIIGMVLTNIGKQKRLAETNKKETVKQSV